MRKGRITPLSAVAVVLLLTAGTVRARVSLQDYTLPNGLQVVLNEDHSAPLVAINIWYHVGSKNEKVGRTGFAHLFEHMLFSGSEHVGNNAHFRYIQSVGGILNGSTNFDRTNYFETVPSNYLPMVLWLESDRMGYFLPALDQQKLDIQKNVVKEERRQRYDNVPYGTWIENLLRLGYPAEYPYHWPTIGSMSDLTAAQMEDVKEFFRTYYSPNNAVLTLSGDFDPAQAKELIEKYFGPIPPGPPIDRFRATPPPQGGEQRNIIPSDVKLPRVYRMYHIPPFGDREWIAADLLANVLTTGKASRLEKSLVLDQQIAQDVNAFAWPTELAGMFVISATAKPGVAIERVESSIDAEIAKIVSGGVGDDEVSRARTGVEAEYAHDLSRVSSRANLISQFTTFLNDPDAVNTWLDRYRAVGAADLRSVASQYLVPSNRVNVVFTPKQSSASPAAEGGVQ